MVLHLRYPNAHTHWFCTLLLHLFLEVKDDRFKEVMTKVLLERFIVHRPHPWGALVTFIELLRNPKYEFWNKDFIRIAPEVSMLLESVSILLFSDKIILIDPPRLRTLSSSNRFLLAILLVLLSLCNIFCFYLGLLFDCTLYCNIYSSANFKC